MVEAANDLGEGHDRDKGNISSRLVDSSFFHALQFYFEFSAASRQGGKATNRYKHVDLKVWERGPTGC